MHVNQDMGKYFVAGEIKGYFNNLTEKVLNDPETLRLGCVPMTTDEKAGSVYFPIAIFQYGLGAYDLYLATGDGVYLEQFRRCVDWAVQKQEINGAWDNFGFVQKDAPYSSMCQGEGASLLLRAYVCSNNEDYLIKARKAIDFMLIPIENGGTACYQGDDLYLYEYTNKACVLNGWIFSIFGLYELNIVTGEQYYREVLNKTISTLENSLERFDNGFWSMYDLGGTITSPFYHDLHIAQLEALSRVFNKPIFNEYREKFDQYRKKSINKKKAFVKKAIQKIMER